MSKREILAELPRMNIADRREIFDRLCEMEERDALNGTVTPEEKTLLDRELEEYRRNPDAGSTWPEVEARIRKASRLPRDRQKLEMAMANTRQRPER